MDWAGAKIVEERDGNDWMAGPPRQKNRIQRIAGIREDDKSSKKNYLACVWGAGAFYALCHGIAYRSADALLLFASLASSLVVFLWWIIDQTALERRIQRLEARSEIAAEKRIVMQTDLNEVEHKLERVETRVAGNERVKTPA
jgi:hypothetical protein